MCCESEIIVNLNFMPGPENLKKGAKYNPADFENFPWIKADGYIWKVTDNIRTKIIIKKKENTCQNAA
jgi:hypothetical protein